MSARPPSATSRGRRSRRSGGRRRDTATPGGARPSATGGGPTDGSGVRLDGWLFDAESTDEAAEPTRALLASLRDDQLLWIDVVDGGPAATRALVDLLGLDDAIATRLEQPVARPWLEVAGPHIAVHARAMRAADGTEKAVGLTILAGRNVVASISDEDIEVVEAFRNHTAGDTPIGLVDAPSFVAALLDWVVSGYYHAIEGLEEAAERLDARALGGRSDRDLAADMVRLRRRVTRVRRSLAAHRDVFAALTRPDLTTFADTDAAHFRALAERLERAIDSTEVARELLIGSFDVHMTRIAQRTNDIMKILTLVTVILLPGSLIAGVMGMNFREPFFEDSTNFWLVVAIMAGIAVGSVVLARLRRWV